MLPYNLFSYSLWVKNSIWGLESEYKIACWEYDIRYVWMQKDKLNTVSLYFSVRRFKANKLMLTPFLMKLFTGKNWEKNILCGNRNSGAVFGFSTVLLFWEKENSLIPLISQCFRVTVTLCYCVIFIRSVNISSK